MSKIQTSLQRRLERFSESGGVYSLQSTPPSPENVHQTVTLTVVALIFRAFYTATPLNAKPNTAAAWPQLGTAEPKPGDFSLKVKNSYLPVCGISFKK